MNETNKNELRFPSIWPGLAAAFVTFLLSIGFTMNTPQPPPNSTAGEAFQGWSTTASGFFAAMILFFIISMVFWFVAVYQLHKVLAVATNGKYPISARKAVGFEFIPIYNIYWMFKWPGELALFLNDIKGSKVIAKNTPGCVFLLSVMLGRFIGNLSIVIDFVMLRHLISQTRIVLATTTLPVAHDGVEKYDSPAIKRVLWVMVGLALLGLVAAIVIPNFIRARDNARQNALKAQNASATLAKTP